MCLKLTVLKCLLVTVNTSTNQVIYGIKTDTFKKCFPVTTNGMTRQSMFGMKILSFCVLMRREAQRDGCSTTRHDSRLSSTS